MTHLEMMEIIRGKLKKPSGPRSMKAILDEPDPPEPAKIPAVNPAFNARVQAVVLLLLSGVDRKEVRQKNSKFVMEAADREVLRREQLRRDKER